MRPHLRPIEGNAAERHASWLELFFDLTFVMVVTQVAHILLVDLTWIGFIHFVALTIPFWWSWVGYTFYASRFEVERDHVYRILMLLGMLGVSALAVNAGHAFSGGEVAFIVSYVAVRLVLIVLYVRAWIYVHLARELCTYYLIGFSIGVILWTLSLAVPPPASYLLRLLGLTIELLTPILSSRAGRRTPYDITHIPERFGLFTIIVLGEALLAVANGIADTDWHAASSLAAVCCFGISASFWWIYFDFVETRPIRRWGPAGQVYIFTHLPLVIAIAMVGVGTRRAIVEAGNGAFSDAARWVICGGIALYLLSIVMIRLVSRSGESVVARICVAGGALLLAAAGHGCSSLFIVATLLLAMVIDVCIETLYTSAERTSADDPGLILDAPLPLEPSYFSTGEETPFCSHLDWIEDVVPSSDGCEECRKLGDSWVQLRLCLTCGYVGCCETSKNKHALAHFRGSRHPLIQTIEPDQHWRWCYIDELYL